MFSSKRLLILLLLCASPAFGQIAFDSAANSGAGHNTVSSITYSHTVSSNTNGLMIACVAMDSSANRSVSGITYNSVSFTKVRSDDNATGTQHTEVWYLKAPATGAHNVVVSFPGNVDGAIAGTVSLTGVNQTTPVDAQAGATPATANVSVSITTVADNAWIVDCLGHNNSTTATMTAHTNRTQRFNVGDATNGASGAMSTLGPATPAGSFTMDWTASIGTNNAISAVSFAPAGGSPPPAPPPQLMNMGVGMASMSIDYPALAAWQGCAVGDTSCSMEVDLCDEKQNCLHFPPGKHQATLQFVKNGTPTAVGSSAFAVTAQ